MNSVRGNCNIFACHETRAFLQFLLVCYGLNFSRKESVKQRIPLYELQRTEPHVNKLRWCFGSHDQKRPWYVVNYIRLSHSGWVADKLINELMTNLTQERIDLAIYVNYFVLPALWNRFINKFRVILIQSVLCYYVFSSRSFLYIRNENIKAGMECFKMTDSI
jgi:hypothetical protein